MRSNLPEADSRMPEEALGLATSRRPIEGRFDLVLQKGLLCKGTYPEGAALLPESARAPSQVDCACSVFSNQTIRQKLSHKANLNSFAPSRAAHYNEKLCILPDREAFNILLLKDNNSLPLLVKSTISQICCRDMNGNTAHRVRCLAASQPYRLCSWFGFSPSHPPAL